VHLYEAHHYNNPTYIRPLLHQISLNISEASYAHKVFSQIITPQSPNKDQAGQILAPRPHHAEY